MAPETDFEYSPPTGPLRIVHEDRDMVVVDKPGGLLSVPGRIYGDSVISRLKERFPHVYAVHRLDMDTSGLLAIALRRKAERELQRQFRERLVEKTYLAIVWGDVAEGEGEIGLPLSRVPGQPPRSIVDHENGRIAITRFRVLERQEGRTRLELAPQTGRSHQLRVHLHAIGHGIVGDRFYGRRALQGQRMLLHAHTLSFLHPYDGRSVSLEAPPPF
jgi:tRNA pseudouridine32 synthase / 23S rRNA pseudouridine746 synthase